MSFRIQSASSSIGLSLSALPVQTTEEQKREFEEKQALFLAQPAPVIESIQSQVFLSMETLERPIRQWRFTLPEEVCTPMGSLTLPPSEREHTLARKNGLRIADLERLLSELEQSSHAGIRAGSALLRHAIALHLINYRAHSQPQDFDGDEAEFSSCQRDLRELVEALAFAPYFTADEAYRQKREERLGRLAQKGIAIANRRTQEIILGIKQRAAANTLNRGLGLSLPYYDDRALSIKTYDIEVIPPGRVAFEAFYVMWVARDEQEKVAQNMDLSLASRNNLLAELKDLELAFEVSGTRRYRRQPARKKRPVQSPITALKLAWNAFTTITINKEKGT